MAAVDPPSERSVALTGGRARGWLKLLFAGVILAALVAVIPRHELADALRRTPPWLWLAAPTAFLAVHLIGVAKWQLLQRAAGSALPVRTAVRCHYSGLFGNLLLPSVIGGDAVRVGLALPHSRSRSGLLLASVVDRALDLTALLALAAVGTMALPATVGPEQRGLVASAAALLLGAAAGLAGIAWKFPYRRLSIGLRRPVGALRRALRRLRWRPAALLGAFALAVVLQLVLLGLAVWLGRTAGLDASFAVWLVVWPLAKLAGLVPLTQGGIGVREVALVALFRPFGVPAATAVATGLLFEAMLIGGSLGAGGAALLLAAPAAPHAGDAGDRARRGQR